MLTHYVPIKNYELYHDRIKKGLDRKNVIFSVPGGLGDRICAEPAIRYFVNHFKQYNYSVICANPELFKHLNVKTLSPQDDYDFSNNIVYVSMWTNEHLITGLISSITTHPVDYASLSLFGTILPNPEDKIIKTDFNLNKIELFTKLNLNPDKKQVVVHAGVSWPSKTFPKKWWESVVNHLCQNLPQEYEVILVGMHSPDKDESKGCYSFDLNYSNYKNLTNRLTVLELGSLLKHSEALISNDSSPIHLAAAAGSHTKIGYISILKNERYLSHWRLTDTNEVVFGWRTKNLAKKDVGLEFIDPVKNFYANDAKTVLNGKTVRPEEYLPGPEEVLTFVLK